MASWRNRMSENLEVTYTAKCTYVISFETEEQKEEWLEERNTGDMRLEYEVGQWSDGQKDEFEYR